MTPSPKGRKKPTAIDAYECYGCKTRHTTENMVAYCASCCSRLTTQCLSLQAQLREARAENARLRKIEAKLAAAKRQLKRSEDTRGVLFTQAAELRRALERIAEYGGIVLDGDTEASLRVVIKQAKDALASLPASVQARAEREKARDAVVEAAKLFEKSPCTCANNPIAGQNWRCRSCRLFAALARLAALDSAQKGERR